MSSAEDDHTLTDDQMAIIINSAVGINIVSLLCIFAVLGVYTFLRITRPALVNRTSLRLAVATTIADLFYSIAQLISDTLTEDGTLCALSVWWYIGFTLLSVFITAAVAVNLQVVFLRGRHDARHLEKWYYIVSIVLATVISGSGYFAGQYGWDELQQNCWFSKDGQLESVYWQWGTMYIWVSLVILYCIGVIAAVLYRINKEADNLHLVTSTGGNSQRSSILSPPASPTFNGLGSPTETLMSPGVKKHMHKKRKRQNLVRILRRIVLYPAIPIFTQSPNLFVTMQAYVLGYNTFWLVYLSFAANSIQGVLNCIIFFMDPAVKSGIADYRQERRERSLKAANTSNNVPTMVLTSAETSDKAPLVNLPTKAHSGSYAKKWRKKVEGQLPPPSPTETVFGETGLTPAKGQDFLGVQIETGTWKFSNQDEEDWFQFL